MTAPADLIVRPTGFDGEVRRDRSNPDGRSRRLLETGRAEQAFGFRAEVGLEEGLRRRIDWWEACHG